MSSVPLIRTGAISWTLQYWERASWMALLIVGLGRIGRPCKWIVRDDLGICLGGERW